MKLKTKIIIAITGFSIFAHVAAYAEDELRLCGVVKKVDLGKKSVLVDVKSVGAKGLHTFKLLDNIGTSSFRIGTRKCFYIDSNQFKEGYVYTIINNERD
ncbi:MAG: hypothetical protein ACI8ZB_000201 [Desulforhopalus sp.]|jgi:hypothetical protein